jgi:hypothetical protein
MRMKYVVVERNGVEELYIFPVFVDHDSFAEVLSDVKTGGINWSRDFAKPISAGFTDGTTCNGRSETLGLDSRKVTDTKLLRSQG